MQRLCCFFPSGQFPFFIVKMILVSPVISGFQGGCKVTAKRTSQRKGHIKNGARHPKLPYCSQLLFAHLQAQGSNQRF
jgi:hypothetical protein